MFDLINRLLIAIEEAGWTDTLYNASLYIIIVTVIVWSLLFSRKMGMKVYKGLIVGALAYLFVYYWMVFYALVSNGFQPYMGMNNLFSFVYTPLFLWLVAKIFKLSWTDTCYLIAPMMPLQQAIAMGECIFGNCCRGYPCSWGIYSVRWDYYYFPIQQINVILNFAIFIILLLRARKNKYKPDPYQYPLMLVMVGAPRFFIEFLHDNEKVFLGCSELGLYALFMTAVGIAAIFIIKKKQSKKAVCDVQE